MRLFFSAQRMALCLIACTLLLYGALASPAPSHQPSAHNNNWAVLVGTSKYWFNYRHNANALSLYRTVKALGIPDDHILLLLPEDTACTPRNPFSGRMFNSPGHETNLYDAESVSGLEVDYRGAEVTVEAFLRLLTNKHHAHTPDSKKLLTDERSNVLVYLSGHGGDGFLKFQDAEVLSAQDVADAVDEMKTQKRFNELFLIVDTCQASSLPASLRAQGVLTLASSAVGENSYSHATDARVGNALVDKLTHHTLEFFARPHAKGRAKGGAAPAEPTVGDYLRSLTRSKLQATPVVRRDLFSRPLDAVPVSDFFGAATRLVHVTAEPLPPAAAPPAAAATPALVPTSAPQPAFASASASAAMSASTSTSRSAVSSEPPELQPSPPASGLVSLLVAVGAVALVLAAVWVDGADSRAGGTLLKPDGYWRDGK